MPKLTAKKAIVALTAICTAGAAAFYVLDSHYHPNGESYFYVQSAHFIDDDHGWVAGTVMNCRSEEQCVYMQMTADGGSTWRVVKTPPVEDVFDIEFTIAGNGRFSDGKEVFTTDDWGATWKSEKPFNFRPTPESVQSTGIYYFAGSSRRVDLLSNGAVVSQTYDRTQEHHSTISSSERIHSSGRSHSDTWSVHQRGTIWASFQQISRDHPSKHGPIIRAKESEVSIWRNPCDAPDEYLGQGIPKNSDQLIVTCLTGTRHIRTTRVFMSNDEGKNFSELHSFSPPEEYYPTFVTATDQTVFAHRMHDLLASNDFGATWRPVFEFPHGRSTLYYNPEPGFASSRNGKLIMNERPSEFYSYGRMKPAGVLIATGDGGSTWEAIEVPLPDN